MVLLLTLFFMWRWCKWLQKLEETPNEELGRFNRWAKRELFEGDDYHYPPFY